MQTDTFTARAAAVGLIVAGLGALAAIAVLAIQQKTIPDVLPGVVLGAFGILAPSPVAKTPSATPDVHVQNVYAPATAEPAPAARKRSQRGSASSVVVGVLALIGLVAVIIWLAH